ncbi:hypothetical protein [Parabacteroides sp. Marseille-P3160]|uniref:hypothetical protein n=1 Tax=Parabacteroides sp. Marseille-P3160 TaxID=1917887 RepID=UPI0009BAD929|nr:hypothetical protein [Parabacteroides sp. Marseille-P3160]
MKYFIPYSKKEDGSYERMDGFIGEPGKSPVIRDSSALGYKTWWVYDNDLKDYVDTGVRVEAIVAIEDGTIQFTGAASRQNLTSGEKLSISLGKIWKWFADLGSLAFKSAVAWGTDITGIPSWIGSSKPSYTKSEIGLGSVDNTSDASKPISTAAQTALNAKANLVDGKVPASELPSYVDDVLEGTLYSETEFRNVQNVAYTPESGKIYTDLTTNLQYRWSGSVYVVISPSLALGETSNTAFAGNRGKAVEDRLAGIAQVNGSSTLATSAWVLNTTSNLYEATISNASIKSTSIIDAATADESYDAAADAQLYPSIDVSAGSFKVKAKSQPTGDVIINYSIINL